MSNYKVIKDNKLSTPYQSRYIVVDKKTGEVLDNAQGYGYKTIQNAYAAYEYKTKYRSNDAERLAKKKRIHQWMKEHKNFVKLMDAFAFEISKGSWGPDAKFDAQLLKEMLIKNNLETDFTAGELLREWENQ